VASVVDRQPEPPQPPPQRGISNSSGMVWMKHHNPVSGMLEPRRIRYLRDDEGSWLAVELVAVAQWSSTLLELPDP